MLLAASDRQVSRPAVYRGARRDEALTAVAVALLWAGVFALAAWLWPDGVPAWGAVIMPAAAVAVSLYLRVGAPRYQSWFLGTQDRVLPAALAFGRSSYRRAIDRAGRGQPLRVAAVSASPATFDPFHVPGYSDVDATIGRYQPHIAAAIAQGARLIVLPEYAVVVSAQNRQQWLAAVSRWASQAHAPVVSGVIEPDRHKNQLVIADQTGAIAVTHDKQHPAPFLELLARFPPVEERETPGVPGPPVCVTAPQPLVSAPSRGIAGR